MMLRILAFKGISSPKTHKGLKELFGKEVILKGLIEKDFGRDLTIAFELRHASTYDICKIWGRCCKRNN